MAHLALEVPIVLHDGVALLEVLCVFDNVVCIAWLCVLGPVSRGFAIGVLPFPGMVEIPMANPTQAKEARMTQWCWICALSWQYK